MIEATAVATAEYSIAAMQAIRELAGRATLTLSSAEGARWKTVWA